MNKKHKEEKEKLLKKLKELNDKENKSMMAKKVKCRRCHRSMSIGSLIFFEHHYLACDGGWDKQDFICKSNSHFRCKHCNTANRILDNKILNLKNFFKKIEEHRGDIDTPWINYGDGY